MMAPNRMSRRAAKEMSLPVDRRTDDRTATGPLLRAG